MGVRRVKNQNENHGWAVLDRMIADAVQRAQLKQRNRLPKWAKAVIVSQSAIIAAFAIASYEPDKAQISFDVSSADRQSVIIPEQAPTVMSIPWKTDDGATFWINYPPITRAI